MAQKSPAYYEGARIGLKDHYGVAKNPHPAGSEGWHNWQTGYVRGAELEIAEFYADDMTPEQFDEMFDGEI